MFNLTNRSEIFEEAANTTKTDPRGTKEFSTLRLPSLVYLGYILNLQTIVGVIGNALCLAVLFRKAFRGSTSAVYLRSLALIDSLVLVGIQLVTQPYLIKHVCQTKIGCYTIDYVSLIMTDMSIWILVLYTAERLIAVLRPFDVKIWLTVRRSVTALCVTFLAHAVLNTHDLWFMGRNRCDRCLMFYQKDDIVKDVLSLFVTTKKTILPLSFMTISSIIIIIQIHRKMKRRAALSKGNRWLNQKMEIRQREERNQPLPSVSGTTDQDALERDQVNSDKLFGNEAKETIGVHSQSTAVRVDDKRISENFGQKSITAKALRSVTTRGDKMQSKTSRRDVSMAITLISLNLLAIVTRVPKEIHKFITEGESGPEVFIAKYVLTIILILNQTLNIFLYAGTGTKFRAEFLAMFGDVKRLCKARRY